MGFVIFRNSLRFIKNQFNLYLFLYLFVEIKSEKLNLKRSEMGVFLLSKMRINTYKVGLNDIIKVINNFET